MLNIFIPHSTFFSGQLLSIPCRWGLNKGVRFFRLMLVVLVGGGGVLAKNLSAQEAPSSPQNGATAAEKQAAPSPEPSSAAPQEESKQLDLPVIEGQDVLGLRVPHYNIKGELIMQIMAEVARRLGDNEIELEKMQVDFWNEEREQFGLSMPKSRYLIEQRTLVGNDGALIRREDFRIEGQNLEFNLETQRGVLLGEVTMTIQNADSLTPAESSASPTP